MISYHFDSRKIVKFCQATLKNSKPILIIVLISTGADLEETLRAIRSGKVTDEDVNKLMTVFNTSGKNIFSSFKVVINCRCAITTFRYYSIQALLP